MVLGFGSWIWFLVLVLGFGSWFWFLVLVLGFGSWFLVLVLLIVQAIRLNWTVTLKHLVLSFWSSYLVEFVKSSSSGRLPFWMRSSSILGEVNSNLG